MAHLSNRIVEDGYDCKILAASFKGVQQVRDAFNAGSQAITAPVSVLKAIFENPSISKAVTDFNNDWYSVYGKTKVFVICNEKKRAHARFFLNDMMFFNSSSSFELSGK